MSNDALTYSKRTKSARKEEDTDSIQGQQINFQEKLQKIIEMMESKYTKDLTDRHVDAIGKVITEMNTGNYAFFYKDLESLAKLLSISFQRILKGKKEFIKQTISLVQICNRPFLKEKTSDELNYVPKTIHLLNALSEVLQNNNTVDDELYLLYLEVLNFLNDFTCTGIDDYKNQKTDYQMKKLYGNNFSLLSTLQTEGTRNLRLISNSNILETLVFILTSNIYPESCTIVVINTMLNCALYNINAEKLANLGVLKDFVSIISSTSDFRSLLVRVCIEAIWNVLENGGRGACRMMAFEEIVNALFYTFNNVIKNCFRLEDRNIRNDICILINYVVSSPESHPYFIYRDSGFGLAEMGSASKSESFSQSEIPKAKNSAVSNFSEQNRSFLEILFHYGTYDEIKSIQREIELNKNVETLGNSKNKMHMDPHEFFLTTSPDDVEFKKIIWTCILYIIKDNHNKKEVIEILQNFKFLSCLLLYLDPEAMRFSCISRWQQPQLKDLQLLCLSILLNITPLYQKYFEEIKGYSTLIKFLQIYSDKDRRNLCLKTINNIVNSDLIKKELTEEKLIDFLLDIINSNENSLESREYAFNIISQMCVNNKLAQKEFRRKNGIEVLKRNLNYQVVLDQIGNQKLFILVALDCLWNAVIGNKRNEEQFIELDGLSTLFELLEQSDEIHIKTILSCIASLVDNKRSFSYFIQWKSEQTNSNIDATKLLINIYRNEDTKYGVEYENGILVVKNRRPLNPHTSYYIRKLEKAKNEENERILIQNTKRTNRETIFTDETEKEKSKTVSMSSSIKRTFYDDISIYRSEDFIESYLNHKIIDITKSFDLRQTIFSIFYRIGFNNLTITSNDDRQTFVAIKMYPIFRNLENWLDMVEELNDLKITPTSDDMNWIMTQIEESEEKCNQAIKQQRIIYENMKKSQQTDLNEYFLKIKTMGELKIENDKLKLHEKDNQ